jgi:hypothetical protein
MMLCHWASSYKHMKGKQCIHFHGKVSRCQQIPTQQHITTNKNNHIASNTTVQLDISQSTAIFGPEII